jgi:uncharacterized protein (DUF362 family)
VAAFTGAQFSRIASAQPAPTARRGGAAPGATPATLPTVAPTRVSLTNGDSRADNTFRALKAFEKEIAQAIGNKRVIIKPNNVIINRPLCASHADQIEGILDFLKSIGKTDIVIAESSASGSTLEGFANYDYNKFQGKYGVKLVELDKTDVELLYCMDQNDMRPKACRMSKMLLDPNNYVISAAKLKTHDLVVATLSLKNIVVGAPIKDPGAGLGRGAANGGRSDKPLTHGGGPRGINYNLAALAPRLHPHLAVLDGFEGMEGTGPVNGTPVDHRVCVASPDWYAADRVGLALMGIDLNKIGYMTYLAQSGMGQWDLDKIEILGPALKDHVKPYKLPANVDRLLQWQQPVPA